MQAENQDTATTLALGIIGLVLCLVSFAVPGYGVWMCAIACGIAFAAALLGEKIFCLLTAILAAVNFYFFSDAYWYAVKHFATPSGLVFRVLFFLLCVVAPVVGRLAANRKPGGGAQPFLDGFNAMVPEALTSVFSSAQSGVVLIPIAGGRTVPLKANRLKSRGGATIGRDAANDAVLNDPSISRRHARMTLDGVGTLFVEDLGSSSGTWQGRNRVTRANLVAGESIRFGAVEYRIQLA